MKKEERNQKEKMSVLTHIFDDGEFGGVGLEWVMFGNKPTLNFVLMDFV